MLALSLCCRPTPQESRSIPRRQDGVGRPVWAGVILIALVASTALAEEASEATRSRRRIQSEFERLDLDHDLRLDREEFLRREGEVQVMKRDFRLYDFDDSGSLTRPEFASVSGLTEPWLRGSIPDPLDELILDAVVALDQSYDRWNERPGELVNAHTFVANFLSSISPGGNRFVTGRILNQADDDADGRISRQEAKRFLQFQLGLHWHNGPPLREPTGRLVRFDRFLVMDRDQSNGLSRDEFEVWRFSDESDGQGFEMQDRDGDGCVTYLEYAHPESPNFFDPIEWFRDADADLDARLNAKEITDTVARERRHMVSPAIASFDDDQDGKLSLREYRLSMLANVNYTWDTQPVDQNQDSQLSYDEFVFNRVDLFQLQRRYFFHRLDRDRDGRLSLSEFAFQTKRPCSIHLRSIEGAWTRRVYSSQEFPQCGWPSVSPDGSRVLFHRWPPQGRDQARIVVMDIDGHNLRELCDGAQPSWSADGDRFVCSRESNGKGVWIMNATASRGQRVTDGWAPKWSPDGKTIGYLRDNGVWLYDVAQRESSVIWRREDHRYKDLGGDVAWSPDSKQIAFLGNQGERSELVILTAKGSHTAALKEPQICCSLDAVCSGNLNWISPSLIVFSVPDATTGQQVLVSFQPQERSQPQQISQFGAGNGWKSACMTPDRKCYIAVSEN